MLAVEFVGISNDQIDRTHSGGRSVRFDACLDLKATEQLAELNDDQRFRHLTAPIDDELSGTDTAEIHADRFRMLWSDHDYSAGLGTASDDAVQLRLRAVHTVALNKPADWVLARYCAALDEAHARGIAKREDFLELFDIYLATSRHEQAERLVQRYADIELPDVPEIMPPGPAPSPSARALWRVTDDPLRLEGFHAALDTPQLLIVSSPNCGFCRRAARALPGDEIMGPLMRNYAIWLVERRPGNSYRRMLDLNREFPEAPHFYVENPADWPMTDFSSTPQFHFIEGGEVRESLVGWRGGPEAMWAIARGFDSIGLLDAESLPEDVFAYAAEQPDPDRCPTRDEARKMIAERTPIMTREDLDAHLEQLNAGGHSPLLQLSQEGRTRLIESIRFGSHGVGGFRIDDLRAQLEPGEIHDIASFFGQQYFFAGVLYPVELLSPEDRNVKAMFECTGKYAQAESSL